MAHRHSNHRLVKIHRNYTVEEIADLLGVHKNTVRTWMKVGLPLIEQRRPHLIHGQHLADFLRVRRNKNKQTCLPGEIYCVRCRAPKVPAGDMVDYQSETEKLGMLKAICPECHGIMNRRVSIAQLMQVGKLAITVMKAKERLTNCSEPNVNSDSGRRRKS